MKQILNKLIAVLGLMLLSFSVFAAQPKVVLVTAPGCPACDEAKQILKAHGIKYTTTSKGYPGVRYVPQLFVDGKYKGYGVGPVEVFVKSLK
jgi:glutaredoxin